MDISRADVGHLDPLTGLFDAYRRFYDRASDLGGARAFLAERLVKDDSVIYIAMEAGEALGFTQLYPVFSSVRMAPMWLLNDLFVASHARGRGVATALLGQARELARETGAAYLMLETGIDNPARKLYERCGWQPITEQVFYTQEP